MTAANLFATAKTVSAKKQTARKPKAVEVEIEGLEVYASIVAIEKTLKALKETYRAQIDEQLNEHFVNEGKAINRRPSNFKGREGDAAASCELRIRSSASGLSDIEQQLLERHGVETEVVETVTEAFIFNPEYRDRSDILEKVSEALSGVEGLPSDLIMKQEGSSKVVVNEDSLNKVFTLPKAVAEQLLPIVGTLAVKPRLETSDVRDALSRVLEVIGGDEEAE